MGTIVKDTIIILQTARKMGWDADFCGQFATYSTAVAEAPGEPAEGFYSMSPGLYAYPDDPRPAVRDVTTRYKQRFGIDINYLGEAGYAAATCLIEVLQRAGRDLNLDTFQTSMESIKDWRDIFGGPPLTITPTDHHASDAVVPVGGEEDAVDAGGGRAAGLLIGACERRAASGAVLGRQTAPDWKSVPAASAEF